MYNQNCGCNSNPVSTIAPTSSGKGVLVSQNGCQIMRLAQPSTQCVLYTDGNGNSFWVDGSTNLPWAMTNIQELSGVGINYYLGVNSSGQIIKTPGISLNPTVQQTSKLTTTSTTINNGSFALVSGTTSPYLVVLNYIPTTISAIAEICVTTTPLSVSTSAFQVIVQQNDLTNTNINTPVATLTLTTSSVIQMGSGNNYLIEASATVGSAFSLQNGNVAINLNSLKNLSGGSLTTEGVSGGFIIVSVNP